mmetsp:Transcript_6093/g.9147  ORF Transcript_6093/g.9147 Transcript_6093/m.9147 type:complete len:103 (-) Transcript_6093:9-317(-)
MNLNQRSNEVRRFVRKPLGSEDMSVDIFSLLALALSSFSTYGGMRGFVWPALLCVLISISNFKHSKSDMKLVGGVLVLTVFSIMTSYLGINRRIHPSNKNEV